MCCLGRGPSFTGSQFLPADEATPPHLAAARACWPGRHGRLAWLTRHGDRESAAILDEVKLLRDSAAKNLALVEPLAVAADALRDQGKRL